MNEWLSFEYILVLTNSFVSNVKENWHWASDFMQVTPVEMTTRKVCNQCHWFPTFRILRLTRHFVYKTKVPPQKQRISFTNMFIFRIMHISVLYKSSMEVLKKD
jgi:hypothetical protein